MNSSCTSDRGITVSGGNARNCFQILVSAAECFVVKAWQIVVKQQQHHLKHVQPPTTLSATNALVAQQAGT
jgi:hypothetical protein